MGFSLGLGAIPWIIMSEVCQSQSSGADSAELEGFEKINCFDKTGKEAIFVSP